MYVQSMRDFCPLPTPPVPLRCVLNRSSSYPSLSALKPWDSGQVKMEKEGGMGPPPAGVQ